MNISLVMRLIFAFGISQLILLNLLARVEFVNSNYLKTRRRYVIVIIFAIVAILTPPDPINRTSITFTIVTNYLYLQNLLKIKKKKKT